MKTITSQKKIPVTILTGYLGAGKTTLLNQLLQEKTAQKAAVVINEYGEANIDHELVVPTKEQILQLNNGCLCCTVREDLIEVLHAILITIQETDAEIDRVLLETSGLAEPAPIAQTFLREPLLRDYFTVDSILTLVDMSNILHQLEAFSEAREQIAFADKLLLTKTDLMDPELLEEIEQKIEHLNPYAEKLVVTQGNVNIKNVLDTNLFNKEAKLTFHPHFLDEEHHHHHEEDISSFSIEEKRPLDITKANVWIQKLIGIYGMQLLRYKGVLYFDGYSEKFIYQGVNMAFQATSNSMWSEEEEKKSVLVFIGKNLDEALIRKEFEKCLVD